MPVASLPVLVFLGGCQLSCMVLGCEHRSHLSPSESDSDCLVRNMRLNNLLEVILSLLHNGPDTGPAAKLPSSPRVPWCLSERHCKSSCMDVAILELDSLSNLSGM